MSTRARWLSSHVWPQIIYDLGPVFGEHVTRTLRWKNGKVRVVDGPLAETKEVIGGILLLEAKDMDHAIELISKHPGVKMGPFEIRPAADFAEIIRESEQRRATKNIR